MIPDALVIGGGAIGCSAALALSKRGARVRLLERSHVGAEASSAAAGILGAHAEAHGDAALTALCLKSLGMYAGWIAELERATGVDIGYRPSGSMRLFFERAAWEREVAATSATFGEGARALDGEEARAREPSLAREIAGAVEFPLDCRIDPPALVSALEAGVRGAGVVVTEAAEVAHIDVETGRVAGVTLASGEVVRAGTVVLTAGAWSLLEGSGLAAGVIEPIRGQMIELRTEARPIDHVVFGPGAYLSPRDDGRVIVGSTQERAGFHKAITVRGIRGLLQGAVACVPALEDAEIARTWSGLRPTTPDDAPLIGRGRSAGLFVAACHFRNGILLAPITGEIVAALVSGAAPPTDIAPFAVDRFG